MITVSDERAITLGRRLVWSLANRWGRTDDERDDLSQEGFAALVLAARAFEPERGFAFITYAHRRVHGAILRAADLLRRRGLTPAAEHMGRKRVRGQFFAAKPIDSLDAMIAEDTTLHDLVAVDGDTEALASMREIVAALPDGARMAFERGELNDDHRRAFGVHVDERVGRGRVYTYEGRTQTITEWSRDLGVTFITLYNRLVVKGWTPARAFETPVAPRQGGRPGKRAA